MVSRSALEHANQPMELLRLILASAETRPILASSKQSAVILDHAVSSYCRARNPNRCPLTHWTVHTAVADPNYLMCYESKVL